jgi:hypothetical protein
MKRKNPRSSKMKKTIMTIIAALSMPALHAQVAPILDCVELDQANHLLIVTWGYVNTSNQVVTFLPGSNNFFHPPPSTQGQPIDYQPGVFHHVFQTTVELDFFSSTLWHLNGFDAIAINDPTNYCAGGTVSCWDTNGNGVCDPSEDINGDGKCDARDCLGRVGAAGLQGPQGQKGATGAAGPAGPPGILAAIATVTVPSTTAAATATCSVTQVVLNGGGACVVPSTNSISGRLASSGPSGSNGWTVTCSVGNATAVALCATKSQ